MPRPVMLSIVVSLLALGVAGASAINSGIPGLSSQPQLAVPAGTGFTFQGRIEQDGVPFDGSCDLQFALFDDAAGTLQVGSTETLGSQTTVTNGRFSAIVNASGAFGAEAFTGDARWLEVAVRCPAGSGSYTTLEPLTELTPSPYATFAMDSANLGGFPAEDYARYTSTVLVNAGGTTAENGARLAQAMADSTGSPSARVLLLLEPGIFLLPATLVMKPNIDLAGMPGGSSEVRAPAGQIVIQTVGGSVLTSLRVLGTTGAPAAVDHISGALKVEHSVITSGSATAALRSLNPAPNALIELRDSIISVNCGTGTCVGVQGTGSASFYMTDTTVGGFGLGLTVAIIGISVERELSLEDSLVSISGVNGTVGNTGILGEGSQARISVVESAIFVSSGTDPRAIHSQGDLVALRSEITVSGNGFPIAIHAEDTLEMRHSTVSANGGTQRVALFLTAAGDSLIDGSTFLNPGADGSSPAIQVATGSLTVTNSTISTSPSSVPIFRQSGSVQVNFSTLSGASITGDSPGTKCSAVMDEANVFNTNTCP